MCFIQLTCKVCNSLFKDYFLWVFIPLAQYKDRGTLVNYLTKGHLPQITFDRCVVWYCCIC